MTRLAQLNGGQLATSPWFAFFLANMARFDEALDHIRLALELDPVSLVSNCHKSWILYLARRYDEAIEVLKTTIDMNSGFALARYFMGLVLLRKKCYDEAIMQFGKAREASKEHPAAICRSELRIRTEWR